MYGLAFIVSGTISGGSAAVLPLFEKQLNETSTNTSLTLTFCFIGYIFSSVLCGFLLNYYPNCTHCYYGITLFFVSILLSTMYQVTHLHIMILTTKQWIKIRTLISMVVIRIVRIT